jgi:hypothetical protein
MKKIEKREKGDVVFREYRHPLLPKVKGINKITYSKNGIVDNVGLMLG